VFDAKLLKRAGLKSRHRTVELTKRLRAGDLLPRQVASRRPAQRDVVHSSPSLCVSGARLVARAHKANGALNT